PITNPAMAKPLPLRRPALFLICESETCPKMTARIGVIRKNGSRLDTRLAIAKPLVWDWTTGVPAATGVTPGLFSAPHVGQKYAPSAKAVPHFWQNTLGFLRIFFVATDGHCELHDTVLRDTHPVNEIGDSLITATCSCPNR